MDGRTPGGKHFAGSGILLANRKGRDFALRTLAAVKPAAISSHKNCGAGALVATLQGLDPSEGDRLAIEWAEYAAHALGVPYGGHLDVEHPFHEEMATYYDGTGRLDVLGLNGSIVPGFDITRQYHKASGHAQEELMISLGIAFGKHGYGARFTEDRPYLVVVIGHPYDERLSAPALLSEVIPVVAASPHRSRIKVLSGTALACWLKD